MQVVGQALIGTLSAGLGAEFTPDVKEAWTMFYQIISNKMKEGLAEGSQLEEAAEA
jgi:hemoglobin-like flavoprotein